MQVTLEEEILTAVHLDRIEVEISTPFLIRFALRLVTNKFVRSFVRSLVCRKKITLKLYIYVCRWRKVLAATHTHTQFSVLNE